MTTNTRIEFQNKHWHETLVDVPLFRRDIYQKIWTDIDTKLAAIITGPRRIGKSIILKQILASLIKEKHVVPRQILFYEFEPGQNSDDIWNIYDFFRTSVADPRLPTYLLFDEIQYVKNYETTIKTIYDNATNVKIFLTGSLSLSYKNKMQDSLAGRFFAYPLYPLSFKEYLSLATPSDLQILTTCQTETDQFKKAHELTILNSHFRTFLALGRFPELIGLSLEQCKSYLKNILNQSLNLDVFAYFKIHKPLVMTALFKYLQTHNGSLISLNKLASLLQVTHPTLTEYFNILELMGLIYPVYNTQNPLIKLNASKKIYVNSSFALLDAVLDPSTATGFAVESYILEQMLSRGEQVTFYRNRNQEIDFLIPSKHLGYEVKFRPDFIPLKLVLPGYKLAQITLQNTHPACLF
ncbi:MAG: ATP-binding protein [bacterium]